MDGGVVETASRLEVAEVEEDRNFFNKEAVRGSKEKGGSSMDVDTQDTSPDPVVVMAKLPSDGTRWVHTSLPSWQTAIYTTDTSTPHAKSPLDPLTNSTLHTLRNKGREANTYLAYIVQNYANLPSTIAFIPPHEDGYPRA
jgi:hypothetical protein